MTTEDKCPWETWPKTVEDCLESINAQKAWEILHGKTAPYHWNIAVTKEVFEDIIVRVVKLEARNAG